jgi:NADPH:quinone reductase-like Zn-dependent oxidoreductase
MVRALGADEIIDHTKEDFSTSVKGVDVVFDTVSCETQAKSWGVIKKGGVLVSSVGADEKAAAAHGDSGRSFVLVSKGARLAEIAALVDAGKVSVVIEKVFPLADAKAAHDLSQTGHAWARYPEGSVRSYPLFFLSSVQNEITSDGQNTS